MYNKKTEDGQKAVPERGKSMNSIITTPPYKVETQHICEQSIIFDKSFFDSVTENRVLMISDEGLSLLSAENLDKCDHILNSSESAHRITSSGGVSIMLIYDIETGNCF